MEGRIILLKLPAVNLCLKEDKVVRITVQKMENLAHVTNAGDHAAHNGFAMKTHLQLKNLNTTNT